MSLYFTPEHEWIDVEDNIGTIGLTDYAVEQLGDITYVEVPEVDMEFEKEEVICTVESVKAVGELYAPLACTVVEVNEKLEDTPELMNESPYDEAWVLKVEIRDTEELKELMTKAQYEEYVEGLE